MTTKETKEAQSAEIEKLSAVVDERPSEAVEYEGVFGEGTTLRYRPLYSGFKEDLILQQYTGIHEFSFTVNAGDLVAVAANGGIDFLDPLTGETVAQMSPVFVYDSYEGERTAENPHNSFDNELRVSQEPDGTYTVTVVADEAFLKDPETVYPVVIDPTYTFDVGASGIEDVPVYSGRPKYNHGGNYYNHVGYVNSTYGVGRLLVKFPGLWNDSRFKSSSTKISSVTYYNYSLGGGSSSTISVYQYTGPGWTESTAKCNIINWNGYTDLQDSRTVGYGWYSFDITGAAKKWKTNSTLAGQGLMLKNSNESSATYDIPLASAEYVDNTSRRPYVTVEYTDYIPVSQVCISETYIDLGVGDTFQLAASALPTYATNRGITWSSSDSSVINMGASGLVCAKKPGVATVYAKSYENPSIYASCTVYVEEGWTPLDMSIVENIEGPPRYFPDGTKITADNKDSYAHGTNVAIQYYEDTIGPQYRAYLQAQGYNNVQAAQMALAKRGAWLQTTYGESWLEKFWNGPEEYIFGVADSIASTLEGTWVFLTDPGQTIEGFGLLLNAILTDGEEREIIGELIKTSIEECWDDLTGTYEDRCRLLGRLTGELLVDYIAAKGSAAALDEISKVLKSSKILAKVQKMYIRGIVKIDDSTDILSRYVRLTSTGRKNVERILDKCDDARVELRKLFDFSERSGNVGIAKVDISGVGSEFKAYSQISKATDKGANLGYVLRKEHPRFPAIQDWQNHDTEAKILNEIADKLGDNKTVRGRIDLLTERKPCPSCSKIIHDFKEVYPNIELYVYDSNLIMY